MKLHFPIFMAVIFLAGFSSCGDGLYKSEQAQNALKGLAKKSSTVPLYSHINWINGADPVAGGNAVTGDYVELEGWAIDPGSESLASAVYLSLGGKIFTTEYGKVRDDVASYLNNPALQKSGYLARIPRKSLAAGKHPIEILVIGADKASYFRNPTDKPLSINL